MGESEYMIIELKSHYRLRTELTKVVGLFQRYLDLWKSILSIFIILINFLVLVSYDNENSSRRENPEAFDLHSIATQAFIYILGGFGCFFSLNIYLNSLASKVPIIIKKHQIDQENKLGEEIQGEHHFYNITKAYGKVYSYTVLIYNIVFNLQLIYYMSLLFSMILGLAYHPFFYTYTLSYLIYRSTTLINVLRAIWNPKYTIIVTIGMMFGVVYVFTVFSYWYYSDDYSDFSCYSLWT